VCLIVVFIMTLLHHHRMVVAHQGPKGGIHSHPRFLNGRLEGKSLVSLQVCHTSSQDDTVSRMQHELGVPYLERGTHQEFGPRRTLGGEMGNDLFFHANIIHGCGVRRKTIRQAQFQTPWLLWWLRWWLCLRSCRLQPPFARQTDIDRFLQLQQHGKIAYHDARSKLLRGSMIRVSDGPSQSSHGVRWRHGRGGGGDGRRNVSIRPPPPPDDGTDVGMQRLMEDGVHPHVV
jgi:hypothetical protein